MTEIRCNGAHCGRLLAMVDHGQVSLKCPRCGAFRHVAIVDLIAELQAYLASLQSPTPAGNGNGAGGFML